jgi:hypothetical protein
MKWCCMINGAVVVELGDVAGFGDSERVEELVIG